jgi:NAD(P)H-nitrite reductase large subunit
VNIVIVGNGVAGITCALRARERDATASITVVSGESDYFFARTALMYAFMDRMSRRDLEPHERGVYRDQRIELVRDWVVDLDASRRAVQLESGAWLPYDRLVLATGARPNRVPWEGADRITEGLVHFVSMQDLDTCERLTPSTRRAVVVGGGLIGIELVECLRHHGVDVTYLVREPHYWPVALGEAEASVVARHMGDHGVDVRLSEEIAEIRVDDAGRVSGVRTNLGEDIDCQMLGVAVGVHPHIEWLGRCKDSPDLGRGIAVDDRLRTSLPDVFACGDCAEIRPAVGDPFVELIWYSAKRQGALVARNLFGDDEPYRPPTFFNSSKFFEIEYTTVGEVQLAAAGSGNVVLTHPSKPVSVRIVHDGERVLGFNLIGSRWDHALMQTWIEQRRSPEYVETNLAHAQFDHEFGRAALGAMNRQEVTV